MPVRWGVMAFGCVIFMGTVLILILSFLDMLVSEVKTIDLEQHKSTVTRRVVV